jgi:hypothetical protein
MTTSQTPYLLVMAARQAMQVAGGDMIAAQTALMRLLATDQDLQEYVSIIAISEVAMEMDQTIGYPVGEA